MLLDLKRWIGTHLCTPGDPEEKRGAPVIHGGGGIGTWDVGVKHKVLGNCTTPVKGVAISYI